MSATPADFSAFLTDFCKQAEPMEQETAESWWQANIDSSPESEERAAAAEKAISRLYADAKTWTWLREGVDAESLSADQKRQLLLLRNTFTAGQRADAVIEEMVDTERRVETAYNTYRPTFEGEPASENILRDILRTSDDTARRQAAWAASKEIGGEVEADVLRLVALRNQEARRLGYPNYYRMTLALQEIEQDDLFALLEDIERQTNPAWEAYKAELDAGLAARFGVPAAALRPWHYADPFFQEAPPGDVDLDRFYAGRDIEQMTVDLFAGIGLEVTDVLSRSDLYEKPNKCQHAFCVHVGRFEDVRVLCNVTPSDRWMGTMLHEFGHAVYDRYLGDDLPFFLREVSHTLTTEAIAMLFGRLSRDAAFLRRFARVPEGEAEAAARSAAGEAAAQLLVFARWVLVMTHFERALYEDPEQDLNRLWWVLVRRFQGVTGPEDRDWPDWAAKLHLALSPVYYHNYLLGEMFASQLRAYIHSRVLPLDAGPDAALTDPAVGEYLRSAVFAPGARLPWYELIASATGEPLNAAHFARDIAGESAA